jgi:hypothetical protein
MNSGFMNTASHGILTGTNHLDQMIYQSAFSLFRQNMNVSGFN